MPGYQVEVYATIDDPGGLTFDPLGNLYVGHIWDYKKINRISPGGSDVQEYGRIALGFARAVEWDAQGTIAGVPGSLLVSTDANWGTGFYLSAILPNEQVLSVFGPGDGVNGVFDMIFDDTGRLLIIEGNWSGDVLATPGGSTDPTPLVWREPGTVSYAIATDQSGHIYVVEGSDPSRTSLTIRVYDSNGQMINDSFAQLAPRAHYMAFGPGGPLWGTDLYLVDEVPNHQLLRIDSSGNATVIGAGFQGNTVPYIAFGPDGALYVSHNEDGVIYRVSALPEPPPGDFNGDGILDIEDLRMLSAAIADGSAELQYDVDHSGLSDLQDRRHWVTDLRKTWIGDANLDGQFNSTDFVEVFQAGKFETNNAAGWRHGDWDGDWRCSTSDFVMAFQDGGYEQGPRTALAAVPEPGASMLLVMGLLPWLLGCRLFKKVDDSRDLCHQRTNSEGTHCRRTFTRILVLTLLSAIGGLPVPLAQANLILNGSFEAPGLSGASHFGPGRQPYPAGSVDLTNWTVVGTGDIFLHNSPDIGKYENSSFDFAQDGNFYLDLTGSGHYSGPAIVFQDFPTLPAARYELSFCIGASDWTPPAATINVQLTGAATLLDTTLTPLAPTTNINWSLQTFSFVADSTMTRLSFSDTSWADHNASFVDNVVVGMLQPSQPGVFRWDNSQLIPGTEGIAPGPGVQLDHRELAFASLWRQDLSGSRFDLSHLTSAYLSSSVLTNANLTGANLTNAFLRDAVDVQTAVLTSTTIYNQWTRFPEAFDPMTHGLTLSPSALGDVNANDAYDVADLDMLTSRLGGRRIEPSWLPDAAFDLNNDTNIDLEDHRIWVQDLKHTWFGDADLNGLFDSADFVQVFVAGRYRTGQIAGWAEGDWDGDGLFDSSDFVIAFVDGGYEQRPRTDMAAVPEPGGWLPFMVGLALWLSGRRGVACCLRSRQALTAAAVCLALNLSPSAAQAQCDTQTINVALNKDVSLVGTFWTGRYGVQPGQEVVDPATVVDGFFYPRSTWWLGGGVWWDSSMEGAENNYIVVDLQGIYPICELIVQADDNDAYILEYLGPDNKWNVAWDVPVSPSAGLQTRPNPEDDLVRYDVVPDFTASSLRISGGVGDGQYSVSEIQAYGFAVEELVWYGQGPGSWGSPNWIRPDGTATTETPGLDTNTTVSADVVAVDGPEGGEAMFLSVVDNGGIAVAEGRTLTVVGNVDLSSGARLALANRAIFLSGTGDTPPPAAGRSTTFIGRAKVIFSTGSSGFLGDVVVEPDLFNLRRAVGSLVVQSGARVTAMNTSIGATEGPDLKNRSTLTVSGAESTYTQTGDSTLTIGSSHGAGVGTGTLTVASGGSYTSGTGNVLLGASGTINLDGGTLNLAGPLVRDGGVLNFNFGALSIVDNLTIGTDGLFGANLTLAANRRLTTSATTIIDPFNTLSLHGGTLSTGALVNHGTLDFQRGSLAITGEDGFNIGTGALGSYVALGTGTNLQVTHTTTIEAGALLAIDGGGFSGNHIANNGTIVHRGGSLDVTGTLVNNANGRLFVSGVAAPIGSIANAGRITMQNGIGLLGGDGAIINTGLITGDGVIAKPLVNRASGQVRAEAGKTLTLTGTITPNEGTFSLQGGTLEFSSAVNNASSGLISGKGFLITDALTNRGNLTFSGDTGVYGDVVNAPGGHIVTSGSATTTFHDEVVHDGVEIRTGAGCQTVFLGAASGAGPFTGTGTVYFEGDLRPGTGPAIVSYGGDVILGAVSQLTMEIAGAVPGFQYDRLEVAGRLALSGTLNVDLVGGFVPVLGDRFDLFDFSSQIGVFSAVELPSLPHGLVWDRSSLYTNGTLSLVAAPLPGEGDYNGNGHLDVGDLDRQAAVGIATQDLTYDLNGDRVVDYAGDRVTWLHELKNVYVGDANLDLEFNSGDMVQVFQQGKYETALAAGWAEGDWDGNQVFDSADMVAAFVDGGYEQGPRTDAAAVPEPMAWTLLLIGLPLWLIGRRTCAI